MQTIGNIPYMKKLLMKYGTALPKKYFVAVSFELLTTHVKKYMLPAVIATPITILVSFFKSEVLIH